MDSVTSLVPQDTCERQSLFTSVDARPGLPYSEVSAPTLAKTQVSTRDKLRNAVADLLCAAHSVFLEEPEEVEALLLQAAALLRSQSAIGEVVSASRGPGGLAPWQIRKVASHVETHLDSKLGTADLADLVQLSVFHFCRAFRASLDESPHTYIMRRRIERAQGMMLQTPLSLAQIAIECGLADQAHLNKSFRRFVGQTPGAWRRARATAPLKPNAGWRNECSRSD